MVWASPRILEFYNKVHSKSDGKFAETPGPGHAKGAPKATPKQTAALKKVLSAPGTGDSAPHVSSTSAKAFGNTLKKAGYDVASVTKATSRSWKVKMADGTSHTISGGSSVAALKKVLSKPAPQQKLPSKAAVTKATKAAVTKVEAKAPPPNTVKVSAKVAAAVKAKPVEVQKGGSAAGSAPGLSHEGMAAFIKSNINKTPFANVIALRDSAGYNNPPKKVSQAEFDKLKKDEVVVRAATAKANKDLIDNPTHPLVKGGDYYGEGTYFARGQLAESHVIEHYGKSVMRAHVSREEIPYTVAQVGSLASYASWHNAADSPARTAALKSLSSKRPGQDPIPKDFVANAERLAAAIKDSGKAKQFMNYEINEPAQIAMMVGLKGYRIPTPSRQEGLEYYNILDRSVMTVVG